MKCVFLGVQRKGQGASAFVPRIDKLRNADNVAAAGGYRNAENGDGGIIVVFVKLGEKTVVKFIVGVDVIGINDAFAEKTGGGNGFLRLVFDFGQKNGRSIDQIV